MGMEFHNGSLFKPDGSSWRLKCCKSGRCPAFVRSTPGFSDPLTIVTSGTTCVGWSVAGNHEGTGHDSQLPWLACVFYILHFLPDVVVHEITSEHPHEIMYVHFGVKYNILHLEVSPW